MATTRTPLQSAPTLRACHSVGFDAYIVLYREGQEDLARESIARWVRNPDLAFTWHDADVMGEQIPAGPLACEEDCNCDSCVAERQFEATWDLRIDNARLWLYLQGAKAVIGMLAATVALLIWRARS